MSANLVALWYLVASVCFILALKGLSHPETARRGNYFGIAGMTIAVLTTLAIVAKGRLDLILLAMVIGGVIGAIGARRVQMTQMPELVAAMHSMVGMAAVLIAIGLYIRTGVKETPAFQKMKSEGQLSKPCSMTKRDRGYPEMFQQSGESSA